MHVRALLLALALVPIAYAAAPLEDDAGSGRDAPDVRAASVWVEPGVRYDGLMGRPADIDHYAFAVQEGQRIELRTLASGTCAWEIVASDGSPASAGCAVQIDGSYTYEAFAPANGTMFLVARPAAGAYRFTFALDGAPLPLLDQPLARTAAAGVDPTCGGGAAPTATQGAGASGLAFAALKTGFRAVVAWSTEEPVVATLRFNVSGGEDVLATEPTARTHHVFVLDRLPVGASLCFEAPDGSAQKLLLANAMNAWDGDSYSINLLVVANEQLAHRDLVDDGLDIFAQTLRDATDGLVEAGRVVVLYADAEHEHSGTHSCYYPFLFVPVSDTPTCDRTVDVTFAHDSCAGGAACAQLDGIQDPHGTIMMNSVFQASPVLGATIWDAHEVGVTFTHELGHYAFGAMDLYASTGETADCWRPELELSVMGGNRGANEFDDETNRCPNEAEIPGYVPTWTLLRERYALVPERSVIDAGPAGAGGSYARTTFSFLEPVAAPEAEPPQDDAGSGRDAPDAPDAGFLVEAGIVYEGISTLTDVDTYAFFAQAGDAIELRATASGLCAWAILGPSGETLSTSCLVQVDGSYTYSVQAEETGVHYLQTLGAGGPARFAFALDGTAPAIFPSVV